MDEQATKQSNNKRRGLIPVAITAVVAVLVLLAAPLLQNLPAYTEAVALKNNGEYEKAVEAFTALGDLLDSKEQAEQCRIEIKEQKYQAALQDIEKNRILEAYKALAELGDYKDSLQKKEQIYPQYKAQLMIYGFEGETVIFGAYEQDNNLENGKEEIEWIILDVNSVADKILVVSKYALDCQPFNVEAGNVTWETSDIRRWVNEDFYNAAFSMQEQEMILLTDVQPHGNYYGIDPGNPTEDKVFLLSIDECRRFFLNDEERMCQPTPYAKAMGAWTGKNENAANTWWWLRSTSWDYYVGTGVDYDGSIDYPGDYVWQTTLAVRPAIWIDISDLEG